MQSNTSRTTRIIIWVIAIVMVAGFIGSYFLFVMEQNGQENQLAQLQEQAEEEARKDQTHDPTAHIVEGPVESLESTDLVVGEGKEAAASDLVRIHYKGTFAKTGNKFDSSYDRGEPLTCTLGGLIAGWQQGVPGMKEGGKRRLVIPSDLAYGKSGTTGIPPNSDLVFEIELIAVNPSGAIDECSF